MGTLVAGGTQASKLGCSPCQKTMRVMLELRGSEEVVFMPYFSFRAICPLTKIGEPP